MASFSDHISEIKSLIYSNCKANKPAAYYALHHLQEQSSTNPSVIQSLTDSSQSLISTIAVDIADDDEEIAAPALKCLGFMIYHPSLVSTVPVDDAYMVLRVLAKVIMTTKMKSVCNLGVWCISMQQFDESTLAAHFQLILRAVVHAIDNPSGSLSTTFEAIQAITKLAAQLSEKMKESSHIWAPPIYRRLLSIDKKERDVSERCLLKIRSTLFPPHVALSKAIVEDMKKRLLAGMKDLLNQGLKVQTVQAWGWFIRLLGSHAMKNRHLINEMLKILEQTFSDHNPQVQIASLVAWEGLVDALIHQPTLTFGTREVTGNGVHQVQMSLRNSCQIHASGFLKSIRLIMTPLIGTISSKCDVSVHSACLNTWCYLLHKVDISINHPSLTEFLLDPIFEAVFRIGPDIKTMWLWNVCLDLLDDFMQAKCRGSDQQSHLSPVRTSIPGTSTSSKCPWNRHPIKWLPWASSQLDFFIKMINIIISHAYTINPGSKRSACDAASKIFRSLLKGVQMEFKSFSSNYNDIMLCLNTILRFLKKTCEEVNSVGGYNKELQLTSLELIESVIEELEPSVLGCPLYNVTLDLSYIENLQPVTDIAFEKILRISSIAYMDMVSPLIYIIVLYISVVIQSTSETQGRELILQRLHKFFKFIFLSYDPLENLSFIAGLLYKHGGCRYLQMWIVLANSLQDCIEGVKHLTIAKMESDNINNDGICHLFSYPFVLYSWPQHRLTTEEVIDSLDESQISAQRKLVLEHVTEAWKSLFGVLSVEYFSRNGFHEDVCLMLNGYIDQNISNLDVELNLGHKYHLEFLSLYGNAVTCILEHVLVLAASSDGNKFKQDGHDGDLKILSGIGNGLEFVARFLKLSWSKLRADQHCCFVVTSRVFSALAHFASRLHLKQIILSFMEIITSPLLQWLSHGEIHDESTNHQLQLFWAEILDCLKRSEPQILFDSSFLKLQAQLLERTLDHHNPSISELTIAFWNSTYGEQTKLDYPKNLLGLLDKLSRNKKINLHKKRLPFSVNCHSIPEVTAMNNRSSKRVALVGDAINQPSHEDKLRSSSKRRMLELTEHQKEVRRAQQGREMDCNGHGPGIRTYTSVDFSQGNEDSQESQEIRNLESILEMLKRGN